MRSSLNMVSCLKFGFAESLCASLRLLTNLTSIRFLMFSIVFPKTELFISSKKPFLNSFVVFARRFVLSSRLFFEAYSTMNIFDPQTKVYIYCLRFL